MRKPMHIYLNYTARKLLKSRETIFFQHLSTKSEIHYFRKNFSSKILSYNKFWFMKVFTQHLILRLHKKKILLISNRKVTGSKYPDLYM